LHCPGWNFASGAQVGLDCFQHALHKLLPCLSQVALQHLRNNFSTIFSIFAAMVVASHADRKNKLHAHLMGFKP